MFRRFRYVTRDGYNFVCRRGGISLWKSLDRYSSPHHLLSCRKWDSILYPNPTGQEAGILFYDLMDFGSHPRLVLSAEYLLVLVASCVVTTAEVEALAKIGRGTLTPQFRSETGTDSFRVTVICTPSRLLVVKVIHTEINPYQPYQPR
jgi:hypothetical protein